jgi:hypothetical protein
MRLAANAWDVCNIELTTLIDCISVVVSRSMLSKSILNWQAVWHQEGLSPGPITWLLPDSAWFAGRLCEASEMALYYLGLAIRSLRSKRPRLGIK